MIRLRSVLLGLSAATLLAVLPACPSDDAPQTDSTVDTSGRKDVAADLPPSDTTPPPPDAPADVVAPDTTMDAPPADTTVDLPPGPSAKVNVSVDSTNVTCGSTAGTDCVGTLVIRIENVQTAAQVAIKEFANADLRNGTIISHTFYTLPVNTQLAVGAALLETSPTPTPTQPDIGDLVTNNTFQFTHASASDNKVIDLLLDVRCSAGAGSPLGGPPLSLLLLGLGVVVLRRRRRHRR